MRPVSEQLELFENIFNNDDICPIVLSALTSESELEGNKQNQETILSISKMILENIDKINFKSDDRKTMVKNYFEKAPGIIAQYQ